MLGFGQKYGGTGGLSLPQAVKIATFNPAKVIKVVDRKGTLTPGKDGDITIFDEKLRCEGNYR